MKEFDLEELKKRFDAAKLKTRLFSKEIEDIDEVGDEIKIEKEFLIVSIPEEREFKNIIIAEDQELDLVAESQIEKYRFIKGYEAIWSQELKSIECELATQENILLSPRSILRRLGSFFDDEVVVKDREKDFYQFEFPSPQEGLRIIIGTSSLDFSILQTFQREFFFSFGRIRNRVTIRIEGKELKNHTEALDYLLKVANSVLFQIDLATDIPLHLVMDRQIIKGIKQRKSKLGKVNFQPPRYEYNKEPLALYWYARTSTNMPLLQYLAFYQVLEFFFPLYSFTEAQQRIKNLLKSPSFDTTKDTDIAQLINIIKISAKGKSIGDEKNQIKATLQHIVDNNSLFGFLSENEERRDFFDQQKKAKGLSKQKISFSSVDNDIRIDVALRIYEIRCRIVHSKDEDEAELVLPYSSEIKNLKYDLELVEFLARKAIIAGARPLNM